jgi:hypothetical protein
MSDIRSAFLTPFRGHLNVLYSAARVVLQEFYRELPGPEAQ